MKEAKWMTNGFHPIFDSTINRIVAILASSHFLFFSNP
jgi:hypothetical protein